MTSDDVERALKSVTKFLIQPTVENVDTIRICFDMPGSTVTFVLKKEDDKFKLI